MEHSTIQALMRCRLFDNMSSQEIESAMTGIRHSIVSLKKKAFYAIGNAPCLHADIVLKGVMSAKMTGVSGRQMEVIRLEPGDIIAPCYVFSKDNRVPVDIETETEVRILRMLPHALACLIDRNEQVRWNYIRSLSDIGVYLASKLRFAAMLTIKEKIIQYLREEVRMQKSRILHIEPSRQKLADVFGVQKFSLIRCLGELESRGAIKVEGKTIYVTDMSKLTPY